MKTLIPAVVLALLVTGCGTSHHDQAAPKPGDAALSAKSSPSKGDITPSPSKTVKIKSNASSELIGHAPAPRPARSDAGDPYWGTNAPGYEPPVPGQDCEPGQVPGPNGC